MSTRRPTGATLLDATLLLTMILVSHAAAAQTRPATSQATTPPVDPDLVGWWRADRADEKEAKDLSGKQRAAKPAQGQIAIEEVGGPRRFRFTPGAPALNAGASEDFDFTADFTAALWVKLSSDVGDVTLLSKRAADGSNGWAIVHGIRGIGGGGFLAAPPVIGPTPCQALEGWVPLPLHFPQRDFLL